MPSFLFTAACMCTIAAVLCAAGGVAEDENPSHSHHYSVFVSIRVWGTSKMNMAVEEVSETNGYHVTAYKRVDPLHEEGRRQIPHLLQHHDVDHHHFGTVTLTKQYHTHRFRLSYVDPNDGVEYARVIPDPRLLYLDTHGDSRVSEATASAKKASTCNSGCRDKHHHHHHHHSRPHIPDAFDGSDAHMSEVGHIFEWLPPRVKQLTAHYMNMSFPMSLSIDAAAHQQSRQRREAQTLATSTDNIILKTLRNSGPPDRVNSIVFLSDGFLARNNQTFFDRVSTIIGLIDESNPSGADPALLSQKNTVPLDRYIAFWNIYAVFQPSNQEGASRPLYGITVDDNLKCYHTPQLERAIQCDRGLALSLAKVSPAPLAASPDNVLIVVIVNTPIYGGTGLYFKGVIHIGHFFNGSNMLTPGTADNSYTGTTTTTYASLINHECGHAMGHLLDEYAMGYAATAPYTNWSNCLMPSSSGGYYTPIPWQKWIDVFSSATTAATYMGRSQSYLSGLNYGTLSQPASVCGYSNYYKGSGDCMMNHLNAYYMCPQCREGYSRAIYDTGFELQWPRYPLLDHVLIVATTDASVQGIAAGGITLHLPAMLSADQYFTVTWFDQNNNVVPTNGDASCPACLVINASVLSTWPTDGTIVTYRAKIEDQSVYILPGDRAGIPNMTQWAPFRMMVQTAGMVLGVSTPAPSSANSSTGNSSTTTNMIKYPPAVSGGDTPAYGYFTTNTAGRAVDILPIYALCSPQTPGKNATCSLNFTQNSYNSPSDPDTLAQYDAYVLYVLGGVAAACVLLWLYAAARYKKSAGRVVRPIFKTEFSAVITLIRRIMMVSSLVFMVGAVGALAASGYFYTKTSFIGKVVIIGGVIVALCLYLMAFVGFWAITNRAKRLVMFNGVIMIVAEAVLVAALVLVNLIGDTIKNDGSTFSTMLTDWWTSNVKNDPANACGWEGMLTCSGWQMSCDGTFYVASICPANCNTYNSQYGTSCQAVIRDIITKWYPIVASCLAVGIGLMGFAIAFNYIYYFALWHMKQRIREANNNRVYRTTARSGISRANVDKAKALYVLRTLDTGDQQHLVREFKRIDEDGSGTLSKKELALFFRKALCYKITLDELNKLYDAMDLDHDGSISLDEFLAVFRQTEEPVLKHPSHQGSDIPLISNQRLERQRLVRERLNSAFEVAEPASPKSQTVTFQPQPMTSMNWPVRSPAVPSQSTHSQFVPMSTAVPIPINAAPSASPMHGAPRTASTEAEL